MRPAPQLLAGRYRLGKRLGGGGFGDVYEAEHVVTEKPLAIKLLHGPEEVADAEDRLLRESRLAARVESDHVAAVVDAGIDQGLRYIAMERLVGEDLGRKLAREKRFSAAETTLFLSHAADGLGAAHQMAIVHRDLKPSNLFLTARPDGRPLVKVLDFGTAKVLEGAGADSTTMSAGTPLYMAPEQFGSRPATARTDVYSLGICAFQMLTGVHYFELERAECTNPFALASILEKGPPESARARGARYGQALPEAFDDWFARCCHRASEERFSSVAEAVEALAEALGVDESALAGVRVSRPGSPRLEPPDPQTETLEPEADTQAGHSVSRRSGRVRLPIGPLALAALVAAVVLWSQRSGEVGRAEAGLSPIAAVTVDDDDALASRAPMATAARSVTAPSASASASVSPPAEQAPPPAPEPRARPRSAPEPPAPEPPAPKPAADADVVIDELWSRD